MNKYLSAQRKKIEVDKWCEGCRIEHDPGQDYILEWIFKNAAWFRGAWETSLCQSCKLSSKCGFRVRKECNEYCCNSEN